MPQNYLLFTVFLIKDLQIKNIVESMILICTILTTSYHIAVRNEANQPKNKQIKTV